MNRHLPTAVAVAAATVTLPAWAGLVGKPLFALSAATMLLAFRKARKLPAVFGIAAALSIAPAHASRAVPKTIAGCVVNGGFISSDGYDIHPVNANGQPIDLQPLEGHAVTIDGDLLPGDLFIVKRPPEDSGRCETMRPSGTVAPGATAITTGDWRIHKPGKDYKDLPALRPNKENGAAAGIGQIEFVCLKSNYYLLLVQPTAKLREAEPVTITAGAGAAIPLTFRNLYRTKSLLSRSLDWDADIHYAKLDAPLLDSLKAAREIELTLAGRRYAVALSGLGPRLASFQRFCATGAIDKPAYLEE
jgi:hypothetical protein